ncbi:MAG: DUF3109 family protein [Bacteroidia bacterium]|nr:DUF3109 family protein [Bacteroidia bacterium]
MIAINNTLISEDIFDKKFVCDLNACKGECCVAGESGAPLEKEEVEELEKILPAVKPYMTKEGIAAVEKQGVYVIDEDRDLTTPLVNGAQCAFVYIENKIAFCAIEKAYRQGKVKFKKPISCHLYPIRVTQQKGIEKLHYQRWSVCAPACTCGEKLNIPVYKFLKTPLVRKYGNQWYKQLELVAQLREKNKDMAK